MRIDVVSIFPEYLDALRLSLVGRAAEAGTLTLGVHNLRDWTTDRHHTVDDTPLGGGAGMVMKADVWGRALEEVLALGITHCASECAPSGRALTSLIHAAPVLPVPPPEGDPRVVLAIPTPSGTLLDQRLVEDLTKADHLVIACGRYEGIDARVAEHYAGRVEVLEYSIGDYVLNGGEVAALVLVEAVARLLPGVVGNPESLAEESHGSSGLLEYPVYTRPAAWRGLEVPAVLLSGHHARIARWRRDRSLERTATRRPDLFAALTGDRLEREDRAVLASLGFAATPDGPRPLRVREGHPEEAGELSGLAAETFPLACPEYLPPADVAAFVAENLSPARFAEYLTERDRYLVLAAELDGTLVGYTMSVLPRTAEEPPYAPDVEAVVPLRPVAELSKIYVREAAHGSGISQALMEGTVRALSQRTVEGRPLAGVWLGTNARNRRARRFYERSGWVLVGNRRFRVGERVENDAVFLLPLVESPS